MGILAKDARVSDSSLPNLHVKTGPMISIRRIRIALQEYLAINHK